MIQPHDESTIDRAWQQVDGALEQAAQLARSDVACVEFYQTLLQDLTRLCGAVGGVVWRLAEDGRWSTGVRYNVDPDSRNSRFPPVAIERNDIVTVAADSVVDGENKNSHQCELLFAPLSFDYGNPVVVQLVLPADMNSPVVNRIKELLHAYCEIAADFELHALVRQLHRRESFSADVDRFNQQIHRTLDLPTTAYQIVNEGRRIIGCDRVSLAARRGSRFLMLAISGQSVFDARSAMVKMLARLSEQTASLNEPLWYSGDSCASLPQTQQLLDQYVNQSHVRRLSAVPLYRATKLEKTSAELLPVGVLVFEDFAGHEDELDYKLQVRTICRHSGNALANASQYARGLVGRWLSKLSWFADWRHATALSAVLLLAILFVAVLFFVPADFHVYGEGRLLPATRQRVFAPYDGDVSRLLVDHSDRVKAGDMLVTLRSSEIEFELARVVGDIQTTAEQLNAAQAMLLKSSPTNAQQRVELVKLAADEKRLKTSMESLRQQHEILQRQRDSLNVVSPIEGQVLTWDLQQRLVDRPVRRGQLLMTIGDLESDWIIEMQIPDRHAGYVMQAMDDHVEPLDVQFILATDPGVRYVGVIDHIARRSEVDDFGTAKVRVLVKFDHRQVAALRPGAEIHASIHCGRSTLGYVWLHDGIEAIRVWLFL